MIWATIGYQSCFCRLYRAYPSLTAKNIINLISILTIWWCPCVESSIVLLEEGVCYDQCVLLAKLFHFVSQGQTYLLLQVSLDFLLLHSSPLWWKGHFFFFFFGVSSRGLIDLHRAIQFQLFGISGWGIDLGYCDIEWFAFEMNWDHSVISKIAPKYCILDSFVGYDSYSISCKGFLPTVVDVMVIWIKVTHSE